MYSKKDGVVVDFDFESDEYDAKGSSLVLAGSKLPCCFQTPTSKLLDVIMELAPKSRNLSAEQKKQARKNINQKLYNKTRPGFYFEAAKVFHIGYLGQPGGHGSQHHWHIFCVEELAPVIESIIKGSSIVTPPSEKWDTKNNNNGNWPIEWGGLYLRSEAELRIAKALEETGMLFFANARGRVGLQNTVVSNSQLTGRIEADFMVFYQGRCMILEVDGQHHLEGGQTVRDYARDRVLLRSGIPTSRFTAQDCLSRPQEVVSEFLSILMESAPDLSFSTTL